MALTLQERLKVLRVKRGLTLEQLAEQTHLSKSAPGSYEADDFRDISHYALIKQAQFYGAPGFREAAGGHTDLCGGYRPHTDTELERINRRGEG